MSVAVVHGALESEKLAHFDGFAFGGYAHLESVRLRDLLWSLIQCIVSSGWGEIHQHLTESKRLGMLHQN